MYYSMYLKRCKRKSSFCIQNDEFPSNMIIFSINDLCYILMHVLKKVLTLNTTDDWFNNALFLINEIIRFAYWIFWYTTSIGNATGIETLKKYNFNKISDFFVSLPVHFAFLIRFLQSLSASQISLRSGIKLYIISMFTKTVQSITARWFLVSTYKKLHITNSSL